MGLALKIYKSFFIKRFDKDGFIPYLSNKDFDGLQYEKSSFKNSKGVDVAYFFYSYSEYKKDKILLFLHGIGPGHTAYLSEIQNLCFRGYRVLTLDYSGCGESGGEFMYSVNAPTRDVMDLLNYLNLDEEVVVVGHSLGAYTALNISNLRTEIRRSVIISGFYSIEKEMLSFMKLHLLTSSIVRFERKVEPEYSKLNNLKYLKTTTDKLLFIHSMDDNVVPYKTSCHRIQRIHNDNLSFIVLNGRKHNPNYTQGAVDYMMDVFYKYNKMIKNKVFKTDDERKAWMNEKSLSRMTEQDQDIIDSIVEFLK